VLTPVLQKAVGGGSGPDGIDTGKDIGDHVSAQGQAGALSGNHNPGNHTQPVPDRMLFVDWYNSTTILSGTTPVVLI
jgi:hypothetical protein